jgi:hypothetical protein
LLVEKALIVLYGNGKALIQRDNLERSSHPSEQKRGAPAPETQL